MIVALILISVGFIALLAYVLFGSERNGATQATKTPATEEALKARAAAESELDRRKRELDEQRGQVQELKSELKQLKKKLHDQRESGRGDQDLLKARAEVERSASIQLE